MQAIVQADCVRTCFNIEEELENPHQEPACLSSEQAQSTSENSWSRVARPPVDRANRGGLNPASVAIILALLVTLHIRLLHILPRPPRRGAGVHGS
jgi:hypothetical protein